MDATVEGDFLKNRLCAFEGSRVYGNATELCFGNGNSIVAVVVWREANASIALGESGAATDKNEVLTRFDSLLFCLS